MAVISWQSNHSLFATRPGLPRRWRAGDTRVTLESAWPLVRPSRPQLSVQLSMACSRARRGRQVVACSVRCARQSLAERLQSESWERVRGGVSTEQWITGQVHIMQRERETPELWCDHFCNLTVMHHNFNIPRSPLSRAQSRKEWRSTEKVN